jgi:hypothetical protein
MVRVIIAAIVVFTTSIFEWILKILYLMTPIGLHILLLQLREKADVINVIQTFVSEDATWTMVYDGVALVNAKPGVVRGRIKRFKSWVVSKKSWWITLSIIALLTVLTLIAVKLYI